jgi:hypothetical protein
MTGSQIGDAGAQALGKALESNRVLETLSLYSTFPVVIARSI